MKSNYINSTLAKEYKEIVRKERFITPIVETVAKNHHASLSGLQFRVKSWKSAVQKATERTALNSFYMLNDMVRYTMIISEENFGEKVMNILNTMADYGIYLDGVTNYWNDDSNGYNGINTQVRIKGLKCEIQFHTEDSLRVKETENHPIYEKMRVESDPDQKEIYRRQLLEIGMNQRKPENVHIVRMIENKERNVQ